MSRLLNKLRIKYDGKWMVGDIELPKRLCNYDVFCGRRHVLKFEDVEHDWKISIHLHENGIITFLKTRKDEIIECRKFNIETPIDGWLYLSSGMIKDRYCYYRSNNFESLLNEMDIDIIVCRDNKYVHFENDRWFIKLNSLSKIRVYTNASYVKDNEQLICRFHSDNKWVVIEDINKKVLYTTHESIDNPDIISEIKERKNGNIVDNFNRFINHNNC